MSIQQLANDAAREIVTYLDCSTEKSADVSRIVEKALVETMKDTQARCIDVVSVCCSADRDLAHKISDELQRKQKALVANLSSMR